jgi:hypothetical protein
MSGITFVGLRRRGDVLAGDIGGERSLSPSTIVNAAASAFFVASVDSVEDDPMRAPVAGPASAEE